MLGDELVDVRAFDQLVERWLLGCREPVLRQILERFRLDLEIGTEPRELGDKPLFAEVRPRAEVDDRADVELATGNDRNLDRVLDDELAMLGAERARCTLRDDPAT